jgi:PQQ-like domain
VRRLAAMAGRCWKAGSGTAHRSWIGPTLLVLIFGVVASGCDWSLFGNDAANTRTSPDTGISTSNVGSLTESWTHAFGTGNGSQIVDSVTEANGVVYVTSDAVVPGYSGAGTLAAFSSTACPKPTSNCTPLWVAPTDFQNLAMQGAPIVANGEVYVSNRFWQAAFSTDDSGCVARVSGTGIPVCGALQIYDNSGNTAAASPLVVNNLLYDPGTGKVFSADGSQGCADKPGFTWLGAAIPVCEPLWTNVASTGSTFSNGGTPTVVTASAGPYKGDPILYLAAPTSGGLIRVFAYDANGKNNCGTYFVPVCVPLWTDQALGNFTNIGAGAVSVANGYAYVGGVNSGQGTLFAFDQNGLTNCASGICSPVFQTNGGPGFPAPVNLAVSGSTVYGTGSGETLFAFNGAGCGQASCTGALWNTGAICADGAGNLPSTVGDTGGPNVSNGVVYVGITCGSTSGGLGAGGGVAAYNTTSGTRLWSAASPDNGAVYNAPIVANGVLYFGTVNGSIYAYAP